MRALATTVILVSLTGTASAGVGPAIDLTGAVGMPSSDVGRSDTMFGHVDLGVQLGRVALQYRAERLDLEPADTTLDSEELAIRGHGVGMRVELTRRRGWYAHAAVGYVWRKLAGEGLVQRGCSVFGGCDAGYYREVPAYRGGAPWMSIAVGARTTGRYWPGIGLELGLGPLTIDRAGTAPDAEGVLVWIGLNATFGAD